MLRYPPNDHIADVLERVAALLEQRQANRYRIESYRHAAEALRAADEPLSDLWERQGTDGLRAIRGVGRRLADHIEEVLETGTLALLERLEEAGSGETPFVRLPGLDRDEAVRIHAALGVETLEELEMAAHDGRLEQVEGMTKARVRELRAALEQRLSRSARRRARQPQPRGPAPPVELLLAVDEEYRAKAEAGELRTIAPRRFNPDGEKWLPILKAEREGWRLTALFSNTARAHELGRTRDWVVLYFRAAGPEDQCTVVTAGRGPLRGLRVVRGREGECREHYGV